MPCPGAPSASTSQLSNQREPLPLSLLSGLSLSDPSARTRTGHQSKDLLWVQQILIQSWLAVEWRFLASTTTLAGEEKEVNLEDWSKTNVCGREYCSFLQLIPGATRKCAVTVGRPPCCFMLYLKCHTHK